MRHKLDICEVDTGKENIPITGVGRRKFCNKFKSIERYEIIFIHIIVLEIQQVSSQRLDCPPNLDITYKQYQESIFHN